VRGGLTGRDLNAVLKHTGMLLLLFGLLLALALLLGRGRRWPVKAWLGTAAAAVVLAVGSSRVLLGVHWLTDVIAGAALGFGWFAVCSIAFGGTLLRFGATAERAQAAADREAVAERSVHP
jgi:membrane-associated phospholipid phosphatase